MSNKDFSAETKDEQRPDADFSTAASLDAKRHVRRMAGKLEEIKTDYKLIPMSDISEEARKLAVAWGGDSGMDWIGDKHKLASDIMNYARRSNKELVEVLNNLVQLKDWEDKHGKDEHYEKLQPVAWENARKALLKVGR